MQQWWTHPKRALCEGIDMVDTADLDDAVTDTTGLDEASDGSARGPGRTFGPDGGADVAEDDGILSFLRRT